MDYVLKVMTRETIDDIKNIAQIAHDEGYRFVLRTIDEWKLGVNDFSKPGEVFYGIYVGKHLVSIGGLNIDPYVHEERIGRVRHVYTHPNFRREGFSKIIVSKVIEDAFGHFDKLRLSTNNPYADLLYCSLGFERHIEYKATHIMNIKKIG